MRSGVFAWLANGKLTDGLDEPREGARGFYDLIAPRPSSIPTPWIGIWACCRSLGVPVHWDFQWLPARPAVAAGLRQKWPVGARSAGSILQPGARWPNKRWPVGVLCRVGAPAGGRAPGIGASPSWAAPKTAPSAKPSPARAGALPGPDRPALPAGDGRVDSAQSADGDQ